jgi:hypothetical protein
MLTLNCGLKVQRNAGLNVTSGRYCSRFCNTHFFATLGLRFGSIGKLHQYVWPTAPQHEQSCH